MSASPDESAPVSEKALTIITDMYEKNGKRYMEFDYVNFVELTDKDYYDFRIDNKNPQLRTFEVSEECTFRLPDKISKSGTSQENKRTTYDNIKKYYKSKVYSYPLYFNLVVEKGLVTQCDLWIGFYIGG